MFLGQKIDTAIDQLDKLRSELQAEYDLTVKPLLVAAIGIINLLLYF